MDDVEKRALLLGDSSAIEDAFEALKTLKPFQSILISQELQIPLMSEQGDPVPPSKTIQSCENGTKIWPAYEPPAITFDSSIGNIRDNRARFRRMSC